MLIRRYERQVENEKGNGEDVNMRCESKLQSVQVWMNAQWDTKYECGGITKCLLSV